MSVVGMGAWEAGGVDWGPNPSDRAVISAMRSAFDAGITWVDTAEVYGDGVSEELVGRAVKGRDDVLIATKVAPRAEGGTGLRPDEIEIACDGSLKRLGRERIDLFQLHWPDPQAIVPLEETWAAMASLQDRGKVGYVGVSNFSQSEVTRCEDISHVDSLQQELNLLARDETEFFRWCYGAGIGVITYGSLAYGLLARAIRSRDEVEALPDWRKDEAAGVFDPAKLEGNLRVIDRLATIAADAGMTLPSLAIAWNLKVPGVTAAIVGSRNLAHVRENASAGDLPLSSDVMQAVLSVVS